MEERALVGRSVSIPRKVFAKHITSGHSQEPPDGIAWRGTITDYVEKGKTRFTLVYAILEEDEDGELVLDEEANQASLDQVREWIDLKPCENRAELGRPPPQVQKKASQSASDKCVSAADVFVQTPTPK